jgi:putative peptidoglycan lipid II flippase
MTPEQPNRPAHRVRRRFDLALALYWPALAAGTHWPNLPMPEAPAHPLDAVLQLDKVIHVLAFGGLMLLVLHSSLSVPGRPWSVRCVVALAISLAYAVLDEWTQGFMAGRTVSLADLVTNALAILGVYLVARQPKRQAKPKRIGVAFWLAIAVLPLALFTLLSPWMMDQLVSLKRAIIPPGLLPFRRLDYISHGVGAFVASLVIIKLWPGTSKRPRRDTALALLLLILSGPGVEVLQHFTGRGVQGLDVLGHSIGVLIAMILWAAWPTQVEPVTDSDGAPLPAGASQADSNAFVGHAVVVSFFTLLSRFAGLARDAVLAAALGLSVAADAFFIGFLVPNLFRRLFGEGALTAAFIPNYTDLLKRDPDLAKRFATLTLTLLSVLLIGITVLAELALWWLASRLDPSDKSSLALYYTRLMLPYMPLICLVALVGGILQVHKRFGPPAAAPLILNGVIVGAVLLATGLFSRERPPAHIATWVAVAVVFAGVLQLIWQAVVLFQVTGLARSFRGCWPTMRSMLVMMGPMVLGLAVFQINALLDALIAFFFAPPIALDNSVEAAAASQRLTMLGHTFDAPLRNGDVAALSWSQRLYQFPLGVFGIAIATAIFPALSAAASKFNRDDATHDGSGELDSEMTNPRAALEAFSEIVRRGLRLTVFIALPASAGLILVRVPLARTVFEHGSFTTDDALRVSTILAGYAASVWAYSMTHTLTRAFYALKDATTPLKISACMVALNLTLNLSLIWSLGAAGLAWSTAISAAGQAGLLIVCLRRRIDRPIDRAVVRSWTRTVIATTAMAGVLFAVTLAIDPLALSWLASAGLLAGCVALGIAVYAGVAFLAKAEELKWLVRREV